MKKNLIIACTGSVATVKIPELVVKLSHSFNIKLIVTNASKHFLGVSVAYNKDMFLCFLQLLSDDSLKKIQSFSEYISVLKIDKTKTENNAVSLYCDEDEWLPYKNVKKDSVLHIDLRKWADILLICPLSANTLAKIANGLSDNLVTCVVRAWDFKDPIILCPAMNTKMWENPFTKKHLDDFSAIAENLEVVYPVVKTLACGDIGAGALATITEIVSRLDKFAT